MRFIWQNITESNHLVSLSQPVVKRLETVKAFGENFRVTETQLGPALEQAVETETFGALKLAVFQVGVVNHLSDLPGRAVADAEASQQGFIRAIFAVMRELNVEQVVKIGRAHV